jgi:hypothetical protein
VTVYAINSAEVHEMGMRTTEIEPLPRSAKRARVVETDRREFCAKAVNPARDTTQRC